MTDPAFPVKKILLAAVIAPFSYAMTILRNSIPGLIVLIIGYIGMFGFMLLVGNEAPNWLLFVVSWLVGFVCFIYGYTILTVTLHRIFLRGAQAIPAGGLRQWTSRETRFLGWGVSLSLVFGLTLIPSVLVVSQWFEIDFSTVAETGQMPPQMVINLYLALLPIAYLLGRLAFVLPATATDNRPTLGWSWVFSKRYHWQTAVVVGLTTITIDSGSNVLGYFLPPWLAMPLGILLAVYLAVFGIAVLSFSYGWLLEAQPELTPPANSAD